jgi:hypothetical protein
MQPPAPSGTGALERVIAFLRAADAEDILVIGDPIEFELFGNSDLLDRRRDDADDLLDLFRGAEDNMSCSTAMFAGLNRFEIDIPTPPAG